MNWRGIIDLDSAPAGAGDTANDRAQEPGAPAEPDAASAERAAEAEHASMPEAAEKPVPLDEHRGMQAQKATEIRRRLREVEADHASIRQRQEEFEAFLLQGPASTWPEAAAKAQYLIRLFAATPQAENPRRRRLIASVLEDLTRLS